MTTTPLVFGKGVAVGIVQREERPPAIGGEGIQGSKERALGTNIERNTPHPRPRRRNRGEPAARAAPAASRQVVGDPSLQEPQAKAGQQAFRVYAGSSTAAGGRRFSGCFQGMECTLWAGRRALSKEEPSPPGVQVAVLQGVEPAGVVGQFMGSYSSSGSPVCGRMPHHREPGPAPAAGTTAAKDAAISAGTSPLLF